MSTFKELKESSVAADLGLDPESAEFRSLANVATERLVNAGKWWGTIKRVKARVWNQKIILPMNVAALERVSINGWVEKIRGEAFEFLEGGFGVAEDQCATSAWFTGPDVIDAGESPISNRILDPVRISAFSSADVDGESGECEGACVVIKGYDACGNPVMSRDADDCPVDGVKIMLDSTRTSNPSTSTEQFADITSITKTFTKGAITVATNDSSGIGWILSRMGPRMRSSVYRVYSLPRFASKQCEPCCAPVVTGVCKMGFVPVYDDDDILSISSLPAVIDACWAEYNAKKPQGAQLSLLYWQSAITTLENQLKHQRGAGQTNPLAVPDDGTYGASYMQSPYGYNMGGWVGVGRPW
jgi:hypothetical protein